MTAANRRWTRTLDCLVPACSLAAIAMLGLPGCLGLGAATVVSITASAASSGYTAWKGTKLRYVDESDPARMSDAVDEAIARLGLRVTERDSEFSSPTELKRREWEIHTERGELAEILLIRLTPTLTLVEVDVGLFGLKAAAEVLVMRIKYELVRMQRRDGVRLGTAAPELGQFEDPDDVDE